MIFTSLYRNFICTPVIPSYRNPKKNFFTKYVLNLPHYAETRDYSLIWLVIYIITLIKIFLIKGQKPEPTNVELSKFYGCGISTITDILRAKDKWLTVNESSIQATNHRERKSNMKN